MKENTPQKIVDVLNALNAIGLESFVGECNWSDGDIGYVLHAGERIEKLVDGNGNDAGTMKESLFSICFRSDGTIWDYEDARTYKSFNPADTLDNSTKERKV